MQSKSWYPSLILYVAASLIAIFYVIRRFRDFLKKRVLLNNLPGPELHPFWGNVNIFRISEEGFRNMEEYVKNHENDKVIRERRGPFSYNVKLIDPEVIGKVLSMNQAQAPKLKLVYSIIGDFLGYGVFVLNHEKWSTRRRLITPAFHTQVLKSYMSTYNDCVDALLRKWIEGMQDDKDVIDVYRDLSLLTLDVVLRCAFTYKSDCQMENSNNDAKEYISAIFASSKLFLKRFTHLPYYIPFYFNLTPTGRKSHQVFDRIKRESIKLVRARRQDLVSGKESVKIKPDFIDILLTTPDSTGSTLSDEDIMSEINMFLFAGHETTASSLSWTLHLLGKHPDIQRKCREEIRSVLGGRESIEWTDLSCLKFTSMCIKESMRLYPPVPMLPRMLMEDLKVDEYMIPKGTPVTIPIYLIHRHPKYWKNPDAFDPTRFCEDKPGGSNFSFIPFSAGHRNCLGQRFAQTEQLIAIALIINKFELESISKEVRRLPEVTLKPEGGLQIKFTLL